MEEQKKTVGQQASEHFEKPLGYSTFDPIAETEPVMQDLLEKVKAEVELGLKKFDGDFFIVIDQKIEEVFGNRAARNQVYSRRTCPRPYYDQSVFKYLRFSGMLEYIWTVPARKTAYMLRDNALHVPPEERDLLNFVLEFFEGTLDIRRKKLNGEFEKPIIDKKIELIAP